jgi:ribosomal protein S14
MKNLMIKDKKKRLRLQKIHSFQRILIFLIKNKRILEKERILLLFIFFKLKNKIFKNEIHNRCLYTYRARALFLKYRMSRLMFNLYITTGNIPGLQQACW